MNNEVIDREGADSSKGFRLQKLRATKLMLETLEKNPRSLFYTAIENVEDVFHSTVGSTEADEYYEEDKNYSGDGNFTLFSEPVLNTLASFFDIYVNSWRRSKSVLLGFYTTKNIGKERKQKLANGTPVALPDEPILSLLRQGKALPNEVVDTIKYALIEEYQKQYKQKPQKGHLSTLEEQTADQIREFLSRIVWFFGQEDHVALKKTVLKLIEDSVLHNVSHVGKEETIYHAIMEAVDERQNASDLAEKVITDSDLRLIFKEAESGPPGLTCDPVWRDLEKLEAEITDRRNLREKFKAVVGGYSDGKIRFLARKACRSKTEQMYGHRTFKSLKFRIWEACGDYLFAASYQLPSTPEELDNHLDNLFKCAKATVEELKKDYHYIISNAALVEGIVLDLFDTCLIAFDELYDEEV